MSVGFQHVYVGKMPLFMIKVRNSGIGIFWANQVLLGQARHRTESDRPGGVSSPGYAVDGTYMYF